MVDSKSSTSKVSDTESRRWNVGGLFWGLLIILVGVLLLLDNLGVYEFNIGRIWQLWPIILIGIGVSMLSLKRWVAALVSGLLIAGTLGAVIYVTSVDLEESSRSRAASVTEQIKAPTQSADRASEIKIDTGAITLDVSSSESVDFADVELVGDGISLNHRDRVTNGRHQLLIETRRDSPSWPFSRDGLGGRLNVNLAEDRLIDLTIDAGAAKVDSDLSGVRLRKFALDSGATSADIKFGDKTRRLEVLLDVGASSLTLRLPKESGVRVEVDGGLTSRDFESIPEVSDDTYESDEFDDAKNQIVIKADTGATSFKIIRY